MMGLPSLPTTKKKKKPQEITIHARVVVHTKRDSFLFEDYAARFTCMLV